MSDAESFITRWQGVAASELSTSQSFLIDLCRLLGVDVPHPTPEQDYMFERPITFRHGDGGSSAGRIDLYRRGAFVLESKKLKQGAHTKGFDDALLRARSQAEGYARALPADEGRPPFVVVVDVGHRIELYSEFSRSGATYVPFPDPRSHRIALHDLRRPEIRERLRRIWLEPLSLDPSRESARVTRDIADRLAKLARSLEQAGHAPEAVAQFLMRCLFTMFAEDVRLLPEHAFRDLLTRHGEQPEVAMRMLAQLWRDMDAGGFSPVLAGEVLKFNGKLFKQPDTLPLDRAQLDLLVDAARADWKHVEPAIFGTLLERALSPKDRHKLGAHYTPRAYVERLVLPTVIEPLRKEWSNVQAAVLTLSAEVGEADEADSATARQRDSIRTESIALLKNFHRRLCNIRVLDPACGSGNFLYVTLEHLKRLEGEVLTALDDFSYRQTDLALDGERADTAGGETVDPHNLLGIELNPRAAAIAEVVLWIGYLQWHYRTRGDVHPPQPVIRDFRNIENRDAVLAHDGMEFVTDERGVPVTRWDGETMKPSAVTGEPVPDETARKPVERYLNPRKAAWPKADFVVGNPPFIGASSMPSTLGEGYVRALRDAYPDMPESADFVMHWWDHAATLTRRRGLERFGFITTNSIRQIFNRRVVEKHLDSAGDDLCLTFAIADHPWVESRDGAAVRIAMTVGACNAWQGLVMTVASEDLGENGEVEVSLAASVGRIHADLRIGPNVLAARPLRANWNLSNPGVKLHGAGFIVSRERAIQLGLGQVPSIESVIRDYRNGRDITDRARGVLVIDLFGFTSEEVRIRFPAIYQHVLEYVKPERDHNKRASRRDSWWLFGEPNPRLRRQLQGLPRYIATVETPKHRTFQFLDERILPDNMLTAIASDDAALLGVLSSAVHLVWVSANAGSLGAYVGNVRYNKTRCFDPYPFPDLDTADKFGGPIGVALINADGTTGATETYGEYPSDRIRNLAEQLDAHRKRQQAAHPGLTLTGMYNVLEKLRSGDPLTAKERTLHEQGLVSVLRQLHDKLDAAVLNAYGWGDLLPLLRVAHGNVAEGHPHPPSAPSTREGRNGPQAGGREDARRAFDDAVLERLVALNAERAAEEARGHVRWLRPEFQDPARGLEQAPAQGRLATGREDGGGEGGSDEAAAVPALPGKPQPWPKDTLDQVRAVAEVLSASPVALTLDEIAARFTARGPWKKRLPKLLDMLVALGRAQEQEGRFGA
ncbi:class I SAM-dependent DNA methyltransferase [Luteimonas sp. A611]